MPRKFKYATIERKVREGNVECVTDLKVGYVDVRWAGTKGRETIEVTGPAPAPAVPEVDETLPETCPVCNGTAYALGALGWMQYYRCEDCGWQFVRQPEKRS